MLPWGMRDYAASAVCGLFVIAMVTGWHEHIAVAALLVGFAVLVGLSERQVQVHLKTVPRLDRRSAGQRDRR
jgi:hypothetical protein